MNIQAIEFPSLFTEEQIVYIGQRVVEAARQACGNKMRDVILYGSYARGDFQEWSDVDIMVLVDGDDTECRQIDEVLTHTLSELDHRMNLLLYVVVTPYTRFEYMKDAYPYYRNVDKEGKRLCLIPVA